MYHQIPETRGYIINDNLTIRKDGLIVHDDPNLPFSLEILGRQVNKMPGWLYGIAKLGYADLFDLEHLNFVFNPQSRSNFPWYAWYTIPKVVFGNYRVVPGYPNLAVSKDGIPIDAKTGKVFKCVISHGYRHVYCYLRRYRKELFVPVYKLVALAWLKNDECIVRYVVNHIDPTGYPRNDSADNLEWTTYKGNNDHAVVNGLICSACACRIRNAFTGEIKTFPSIAKMLEFFHLGRCKGLPYFFKHRQNKLYDKVWEIRIADDDRPWTYAMNCQNIEPSRYIIKVREPDIEEKVFNGVRTLIKHYKLWNLPTQSCRVAVETLKSEHPEFEIEIIDQYDTRPIEIRNVETNEVSEFKSILEAVKHFGWRKSVLTLAVRGCGDQILYDKYVVRRKTDTPWSSEIHRHVSAPFELKLVDKETQREFTCSSLREASREINRDRKHILRCITNPKETDRYKIELVPQYRAIGTAKESELLRTPKACQPSDRNESRNK